MCPTTCMETGMKPSLSSLASFAALINVSVLHRCFSSRSNCLIRFDPEHNTDAPMSAMPADCVFFILDFVGVQLGSCWSCSHCSSSGSSSRNRRFVHELDLRKTSLGNHPPVARTIAPKTRGSGIIRHYAVTPPS